MLDLRYNAMWNDWGAAAGADEPLDPAWRADRRRLVLSWKRLNVSVEKSVHRYFSFAETTRSQILHNGEQGRPVVCKMHAWRTREKHA